MAGVGWWSGLAGLLVWAVWAAWAVWLAGMVAGWHGGMVAGWHGGGMGQGNWFRQTWAADVAFGLLLLLTLGCPVALLLSSQTSIRLDQLQMMR